jgi:ABC-type branched-subunit amino acid transport system ATPase component
MSEDIILEIESLKRSFVRNIINIRGESEDERFFIIDDLNLCIPKGKITALIGGNGAGKTSLFNIISGFMVANEGKILFRNNGSEEDLLRKKPDKTANIGIGRMFQDNHIFHNMTVLENMLIADENKFGEAPFVSIFKLNKSLNYEKNKIEKAKNIFNDLFGNDNPFWDKRFDKADSLSYGQQRLLGLARLLMGNYKLLLLDEPTSGVNPATILQIKNIIKLFVKDKGITVFLIEHNMKFVLDTANFCMFMSHGKITASGVPEVIIGNDEIKKSYLGMLC